MIFKLGRRVLSSCSINLVRYSSCTTKMSTRESVGLPLKDVLYTLEDFAPTELSESWDNTGLLVEPYTPRNITKILLTNDLTEDVALEAKKHECGMIISYHPPIFAPLKSVVQSTWKERIIAYLLENRIALYSPHTSWDRVLGGVNDWLASAFSYAESSPLQPGIDPSIGSGRMLKLTNAVQLEKAILNVKNLTGLRYVRFALGKGKTLASEVETVALCAGSGSSVLKSVAADLYLTGEMLHHDVLDATQNGISVILTNHSDSERGFLKLFSLDFESRLNNQVQVIISAVDKDPLVVV